MSDELLKKTGSGNLFMVFGEPDIELKETDDGRLTLEIHGLDVYDPTTGAVRSSSVEDIAAWFLDTDYDGDAFFVRHAYFTGADDPYERLPFPHSSALKGSRYRAFRELRCSCGRTAYRILFRRSERFFILLDGFEKRTGEVPEREKEIALERWLDFKSRMDSSPRGEPRAIGHDAP